MKNRLSQRSSVHKTVVIIATVVVVGISALTILEKTKTTDLIKKPESAEQKKLKEQAESQQKTESAAKEAFLDSSVSTTPTDDQEDSADQSNVTLSAEQEGDSITILTKISGISDGNCSLQISNGAATKTENAQIIYQPEYSSCAGFSVNKSDLGAGTWQISITATPETTGEVATKSISLEVK